MHKLRSTLLFVWLAFAVIAPAEAVPTPGSTGGADPGAPLNPDDGTSNTVTLPGAHTVPEPAALGLLATGLALLALRRRRG
jgi:hypothetical protein